MFVIENLLDFQNWYVKAWIIEKIVLLKKLHSRIPLIRIHYPIDWRIIFKILIVKELNVSTKKHYLYSTGRIIRLPYTYAWKITPTTHMLLINYITKRCKFAVSNIFENWTEAPKWLVILFLIMDDSWKIIFGCKFLYSWGISWH